MKKIKNKEEGFHYAWVILIVATLVLGMYVPAVLSLANTWQLAVTKDLGFSRTAFSFIGTITQMVGVFFGPMVAGFLLKRNFKVFWTAMSVVFAGGIFAYSFAQSKYHFYILAFFVGLAYITTAQIPMMMLINNWFDEKKGLATSIAVSGISAGGALISPIINKIISNYGWRTSYRVYGLAILAIGLIFGLFLIKLRPEDNGLKPYGYDPDKENQGKDLYTENKSLNVGLTISASLATSFFIFFILGSIMNGMSNGATLQFPPALQEGVGLEKAGVIMSAYLVIGIFGKLVLGRIDDKYGITKALMFGSVTLALSFVAILFIDRPGLSYIFPVIFGFGLGMGSVLPPLVTSSIYNKDQYGNAYGFAQSGTQIGSALGPLLVSIIYDTSGSYNGAWILNIVFAILTGSFWALAHHNAKKFAGKTTK